jgi:hypothetical protein
MSAIPARIEQFLGTCPMAGEGLNTWLLRAFNRLRHHVTQSEAEEIVAPIARAAGRYDPRELRRQSTKAYGDKPSGDPILDQPVRTLPEAPKWPKPDKAEIQRIAKDGPGCYDLWETSPVRFDDDEPHTEEIIDVLFSGDPFLCAGISNHEFDTLRREQWRGKLSELALIVPSPMYSKWGFTKENRFSQHCLDNTATRRYIITEFDGGDRDTQAAVIAHLAQYGPLVLVLFSGGKSLHAWFYCGDEDESPGSQLDRFFKYAVSLGADYHAWLRSQFHRIPDGTRADNGQRQGIIYFDPEVINS